MMQNLYYLRKQTRPYNLLEISERNELFTHFYRIDVFQIAL